MALGDIIVRRVAGANVSFSNLPPNIKLAVICNTRGKNTDSTISLTRGSGAEDYLDVLEPPASGTWLTPVREIGNSTWTYERNGDSYSKRYFIGSHYALASSTSPYPVVDNTLLDIGPTDLANYNIRWLQIPLPMTEITNSKVELGGSLEDGIYYLLVVPRGVSVDIAHWVDILMDDCPTDYGIATEPVRVEVNGFGGDGLITIYWNPLEYGTGDYVVLGKKTVEGIKWIPGNPDTQDPGPSPWLLAYEGGYDGFPGSHYTTETEFAVSLVGTTGDWKGHTTYLSGPSSVSLTSTSGSEDVYVVVEAYYENEQHSLPSVKADQGYFLFSGVAADQVTEISWTEVPGAAGYYVYFKVGTGNWKALRVEGANSISYVAGPPPAYIDLTGIGWDTGVSGDPEYIFDPEGGTNYNRPNSEPYMGAGDRTLCWEPAAMIVPGGDYELGYQYADKTSVQNIPKEYFTLEEVIADHGIGSEAANIARLVLDKSYVGARSITLVSPATNTVSGYITALNSLDGVDVQLIAATMYDRTLFEAMYNHCESLSDPVVGQQERRAIWSHKNNLTWTQIKSEFTSGIVAWAKQTASKGTRAYYGVVDGGYNKIAIWTNPDGTTNLNVTVTDGLGNDISPIIATILAFAKYLTMPDIATPLLEKVVPGVVLTKSGWSLSILQMLEDLGALVIQNRNSAPVVDSSTNIGYPDQPIEDTEMTIVTVEDWLKKDLRVAFRQFRGQKFSQRIVNAATMRLMSKLTNYTLMVIIQSFDAGSVKVYQDPDDPTLLRAFFKYTPVYPIKKVLCEFDYAVARLG